MFFRRHAHQPGVPGTQRQGRRRRFSFLMLCLFVLCVFMFYRLLQAEARQSRRPVRLLPTTMEFPSHPMPAIDPDRG